MNRCNLVIHCGSSAIERSALADIPAPRPTRTWHPIPHDVLVSYVEAALPRFGLEVVQQAHAITHDGTRYFGLLQVENGVRNGDYGWVLGLRNSNDQSIPAGLVAGNSVFVCDNLSFAGEIKVCRKHTRFVLRDLPRLIGLALGQLVEKWQDQDRRVEAYRNCRLADRAAHDLVIQALDVGAINVTQIPAVLSEWREPRHPEFKERNVWSLFNGFTEVLKGNLSLLPRRTESLYRVCDGTVGLN